MARLEIENVYSFDTEDASLVLGIVLQNGIHLFYPITGREFDPSFQEIASRRFSGWPSVMERCVYWENGASISLDEIEAALDNCLRLGRILKAERIKNAAEKLMVKLDGGITVIFPLELKKDDPLIAEIMEWNIPKTDGQRVYWHNDASVSAEEIFSLMH